MGNGSLLDFGIIMYLKDNVSREASKVGAAMRRMGKDVERMSRTFDDNINRSITGLGVFAAGLYQLNGIAKSLQVAGEFEQINVAMKVMTGSAKEGRRVLQDIQNMALATPFDFKDLAKNTKMLMAYGVEQKQALQDMKMIGDIAAGVGLERLPFLTLAFGQIQSKGRLMGEEVRQLSESGVPIIPALSKRYLPAEFAANEAAANQKLNALFEQKKIAVSAQDVRDVLLQMTQEGGRFYNMMEEQSKTFLGKLSNVREQIYFTNIAIGDALLPTVKSLLDTTMDYAKQTAQFAKTLEGQFLIKAAASMTVLITAFGGLLLMSGAARVSTQLFANLLSVQRKEAFLTAIANRAYGASMRIVGGELLAVGRMMKIFVARGTGIAVLGYGFLQFFKSVTGAKNGLKGIVQIIAALFEAGKNFKINKEGIVQSFIMGSTGQKLIDNNVFDTFQTLAGHLFNILAFTQGVGKGVARVFSGLFKTITVVNNAINGNQWLTGQGQIKSFDTQVILGQIFGVLFALRVMISTYRELSKTVRAAGSIMVSAFKRTRNAISSMFSAFKSFLNFIGKALKSPNLPFIGKPQAQIKMWKTAQKMGYGNMFGSNPNARFQQEMIRNRRRAAYMHQQLKSGKLNAQQRNATMVALRDVEKRQRILRTIQDVNRADNDLIDAQNRNLQRKNKMKRKEHQQAMLEHQMAKRSFTRFWEGRKKREEIRKSMVWDKSSGKWKSTYESPTKRFFKKLDKAGTKLKTDLSVAGKFITGTNIDRYRMMRQRGFSRFGAQSMVNLFNITQTLLLITAIGLLTAAIYRLIQVFNFNRNAYSKESDRLQNLSEGASDSAVSSILQKQADAAKTAQLRRQGELSKTAGGWGGSLFRIIRNNLGKIDVSKLSQSVLDKELDRIATERAGARPAIGSSLQQMSDWQTRFRQERDKLAIQYAQEIGDIYGATEGVNLIRKGKQGDYVSVSPTANVSGLNDALDKRNAQRAIDQGRFAAGITDPTYGKTVIIDNKIYLPDGTMIGRETIPMRNFRQDD